MGPHPYRRRVLLFNLRPFDARSGRVEAKNLRNLRTNAAGRVIPIHPLHHVDQFVLVRVGVQRRLLPRVPFAFPISFFSPSRSLCDLDLHRGLAVVGLVSRAMTCYTGKDISSEYDD
jgi:hypothetical protein